MNLVEAMDFFGFDFKLNFFFNLTKQLRTVFSRRTVGELLIRNPNSNLNSLNMLLNTQ